MAVQLQITLPLGWASDFDRVAERWFFFHRPSGYCQYPIPKSGDEITHAAELVPRLPPRPVQNVQGSITTTTEGMYISQDKQHSTIAAVVVQQTQSTAPVSTATAIVQSSASMAQQALQVSSGPGNAPQQNVPAAVPDPLRRASGSVTRKPLRKPLPRQSSAPVQQLPQASVQQRQDSQISPRTSISQPSIPEGLVQTQQPLVASPRSSMSGTSNAENTVQQSPQQYAASSQSSISQTSTAEVAVQHWGSQSINTPRSSISQQSILEPPLQRTVSEPIPTHSTMQSPQPSYNPQYASNMAHSPGITPIQEWTDAQIGSGQNASVENPGVSSWAEEFGEAPQSSTQFQSPYSTSSRPKLVNRLSTSAIKMSRKSIEVSKKSYEASRDYAKAHPGKTTAIASGIVGGVGVVANAFGVDGLSDAVAASKVYLNVKRAQQRKRISHSVLHAATDDATAGTGQNAASPPATTGPSAQEVAHELFKMMQQQSQLHSMGQNAALQNNINQNTNQAAPSNSQIAPQQYFTQQYTQPQLIPQLVPQPLFVQPDPSSTILPFVNQVQPMPDASILSYQPPSSPTTTTIPTDPQTLLSQYPTPPLSFSDPSSPLPLPFNTLSITPDPSTLAYDQFLQDQTATAIANQAIFNSQAFTTSTTGQDMFVSAPADGTVEVDVVDPTGDVSASWTAGAEVTVEEYEDDGDDDCGDDYDF